MPASVDTVNSGRSFTTRERALSLAAVIAASFGVGLAFGIGFPLTSLTLEAWNAPKWVLGLAGAAPSIAVLVMLPFLPAVIGRIGAVPAIAWGCLIAALGFIALSFVSSPAAWIVVRLIMSAGIALPWLVGETWINTVSTDGTRGRVIALYAVAFFSGFAVGPLLLGVLGNGLLPFAAGAAATALAGVPIILARRLAPDLTHDAPIGMSTALRLAPIGMIGGFIGGFAEISYISLLPNVALASGAGEADALRLLTMLSIGGGLLQFPLGWLADKFNKTSISLILAMAFVVASAMLPLALGRPLIAPAVAFVLGGVVLGFYTVGLSIIGEKVTAKDIAAANAAFLVMYQSGAIIGPIAAGTAMTFEPVSGFIITLSALMLISAIALYVLSRPKPSR
ncbi:MAG TPA: MFS transporter [Hyphomicrobium sp.]|nr:MFS transporter [Hyphomicrobium sp.]